MNFDDFFDIDGLLLDDIYLKNNKMLITNTFNCTPIEILNKKGDHYYKLKNIHQSERFYTLSLRTEFNYKACYSLALIYYNKFLISTLFEELLISYTYIIQIYQTDYDTINTIDNIQATKYLELVLNILVNFQRTTYFNHVNTLNQIRPILYTLYKLYKLSNKYNHIYIPLLDQFLLKDKYIFNDETEYIHYLEIIINNLPNILEEKIYNSLFTKISIYPNKLKKYNTILQNHYISSHQHIKPLMLLNVQKNKKNIGYISDSYSAILFKYMKHIFNNHDYNKYNIFIYTFRTKLNVNNIHKDVHKYVHYKYLNNTSSKDIATIIKNDNIDILIDQMQFTIHSKMDILCYKPAKHIISYLASPISSIYVDYIFLDKYLYNNQDYIKEKILYLPYGIHCYDTSVYPKINKKINIFTPVIRIGFTGCFFKMTDTMFNIINSVLDNNNNVILLIRNSKFKYLENKDLFLKNILPKHRHKINISTIYSDTNFYDIYNHIDILLDIYPYGGCTTIFDALYMNTVCVSLKGNSIQERYAWSFFNLLGFPELCVDTEQQLVDKISYLCNNPDSIKKYESLIKKNIIKHPMTNCNTFIKDIEHHYDMLT